MQAPVAVDEGMDEGKTKRDGGRMYDRIDGSTGKRGSAATCTHLTQALHQSHDILGAGRHKIHRIAVSGMPTQPILAGPIDKLVKPRLEDRILRENKILL